MIVLTLMLQYIRDDIWQPSLLRVMQGVHHLSRSINFQISNKKESEFYGSLLLNISSKFGSDLDLGSKFEIENTRLVK